MFFRFMVGQGAIDASGVKIALKLRVNRLRQRQGVQWWHKEPLVRQPEQRIHLRDLPKEPSTVQAV